MQAKDITNALGIKRERIKYYKDKGVFIPENPKTNGKIEYTDNDFETLKRLVILTKAGLSCPEIQKVQSGKMSLNEAIRIRAEKNKKRMERIKGTLKLSEELLHAEIKYESMPTESLLQLIKNKEQEGELFMDIEEDYYSFPLLRAINCPCCNKEFQIDLEDFIYSQSSDEKENGMGYDTVYYFDSEDTFECPECKNIIKIEGWIREYPVGAYDSENINVNKWEE